MKKIVKIFVLIIYGTALIVFNRLSYAIDLRVTPFLQAQEIFSDNINLQNSDNKQSAFVTALNPGVSVFAQSAKSLFNFNYRMQNLYNARGDGDVDIFNQLQANENLILVPNHFFVNARASLSQQNTTNTLIANDNISGSGNRTNVGTFGVSPTWRTRFGNYANALFQLDFDTLASGANGSTFTNGANQSTFSDSVILSERIILNSGPEFHRVSWGLSFNNTDNFRTADSESDVSFQNYNGIIRTNLNRQFSLFAQGGFSDNSFQSSNTIDNGFFYTIGAQWQPSNYYSIMAGYGNNRFITVNISPNRRLHWITTYRNNEIGLNSGQTWQTLLTYRTPKASWTLRHDNDTTTTQSILLEQQLVTVDINPDPLINEPTRLLFNIPTLTNEVIVRKLWNLSFSYFTGKSRFLINGFLEDRSFESSNNNETVSGVNGVWNWQLASRTTAYFSPSWQLIDRSNVSSPDNQYNMVIGMSRVITNRLTGSLEFRHINQSSDLVDNTYQENRATASLFMRF